MQEMYPQKVKAIPHNSRLTAQAPLRRLRHGICVAKMLDNVGLWYPHRASGAKAPRTLRPLPLLRFAVSATGGAHLCSMQKGRGEKGCAFYPQKDENANFSPTLNLWHIKGLLLQTHQNVEST